jgi:hypothetical protein
MKYIINLFPEIKLLSKYGQIVLHLISTTFAKFVFLVFVNDTADHKIGEFIVEYLGKGSGRGGWTSCLNVQ